MSQSDHINRQWILAERPVGEPDDNSMQLIESPVPAPGPGEMLLRAEYLSVDPYMRGRMSAAASYATPGEFPWTRPISCTWCA